MTEFSTFSLLSINSILTLLPVNFTLNFKNIDFMESVKFCGKLFLKVLLNKPASLG